MRKIRRMALLCRPTRLLGTHSYTLAALYPFYTFRTYHVLVWPVFNVRQCSGALGPVSSCSVWRVCF